MLSLGWPSDKQNKKLLEGWGALGSWGWGIVWVSKVIIYWANSWHVLLGWLADLMCDAGWLRDAEAQGTCHHCSDHWGSEGCRPRLWTLHVFRPLVTNLAECCSGKVDSLMCFTPGIVHLKSLYEYLWENWGCTVSILESLWGFQKAAQSTATCPLPPSRLSLLFPLIPQTVSVLQTFEVSNRMLFSKQNSSHSKHA